MSRRERLARIFGVTFTQPVIPLLGAGVMALAVPIVGVPLLGAGALVASVMTVRDHRAIARGLREVEGWGFPVEGYADWLLANEPAFDLELAHDISMEVIRGSIEAVDRSAVVERRGERVVRVVTRTLELESTFVGGDRRLLFELRDRILAPLHADTGIVTMRMGERAALGALVAAPSTTTAAFRDQALTAPPALQQLVIAKTAQSRPPSEARTRDHRALRIVMARGVPLTGNSAFAVLSIVSLMIYPVLGPLAVAGTGLASIAQFWATSRAMRKRVDEVNAEVNRYGFPVEGFDDWLISGRPIFDVELAKPGAREVVVGLLGQDLTLLENDALTWIDDTLLRIETVPRLVPPNEKVGRFWGGDPGNFRKLLHVLLIPLHARFGIIAVRMGGYVERRA